MTMDPGMIQQVMDAVQAQFGNLPPTAQTPVILTDSDIRRFVKKLLDFKFPDMAVLSYDQLTSEISVQPLGFVTLVAKDRLGAQQSREITS